MLKKIDKPKVFISYAWADDDYQKLVLAFASQLVSDGIDVILDKWDLVEGNNTYAFMEQCVNNLEVTNVLMLLDPVYAKKANEYSGGVGTETQIISPNVYAEANQDKFIPVVMKLDSEGNVRKPTYLQGSLHFNLANPETYNEEYRRLVKRLYGIETYVKPALGNKPSWVDSPIAIAAQTIVAYDTLKEAQPKKVMQETLTLFLNDISKGLLEFAKQSVPDNLKTDKYIALFDETVIARTNLIQLLNSSCHVEESYKCLARFFEETRNRLQQNSTVCSEIVVTRIHELFIYVIAHFLRLKDYEAAGYLLGKTYFNNHQYTNQFGADNYRMFYSGPKHIKLDEAIKSRDKKNYCSGVSAYWIETLDPSFSKEQFILADLICCNYSVYGSGYQDEWPWFPLTYVYDNEYNSVLGAVAKKLVSLEYAQELLPLFGFSNIDEFRSKIKSIEENPNRPHNDIRFPGSFDSAPILGDYVKAKDVGTFR